MKRIFLDRILLSALVLCLSTGPLLAQNVVGTWKRTAMLLTEASGKTKDSTPELTRAIPCTPDITYTFLADGTMKVTVPESCGRMKPVVERMNEAGRWSITGSKLWITVPDKSLPDSGYKLSVSGNTMTWDFDYAANPQMPNPTKAKRLVIKYVRL
ncbi:lipocalin family protein [Larkinella terrae]|uniref:Lipocalin-like domain-containing protein n=1 Tax=Larkinella terrae TaxID=2025311 RepID=A0A7K0EFM9_9BACT|nr:lipocalin family protein [Larkinella terrae]MRS60248.1 hypothetical protein [Larkinella terrae]